MKKMIVILGIATLTLGAKAQDPAIDKLFDKYYGKDGFTSVLVTPGMFKVMSESNMAEGELDGMFKNIKRVRVIAQDEKYEGRAINFYDEVKNNLDFTAFEELLTVKEKDQEVKILVQQKDGKINTLLVLVGGDENVMVSVEGKFSFEDLSGLSGLAGLEQLDMVDIL